ncbi:MAG TPA: bifunctional phosphopantothenoylcysteine decarboxylase/phosphopantothenate--cysteine ligase CoaBC [Armatimonadota bacterium]|nr:bifunctional phosphopantothenoylcysteine decarboxylase/phosphopantothenate--cysteine ligase CoaBC [Armatimonadota bacterium]
MTLSGKTIVLGVTGGIAAYKAVEICSTLVQSGACVYVVMTEHATQFVGPVTFRALTENQVITGLWDEPHEYEIAHVSLSDKADLFLIAPATANILGKIASGVADDMLSTMVMATRAPVVLAPAMNCKMWENPIVRANVERLESLGYAFVGPEVGRLACGEEGVGRLAATERIVQAVIECLERKHDLDGVPILVTAGPTQEPIDPVRFIANRSSGKMGYAIAGAAAERGAKVVLVSGPTSLPAPSSANLIRVQTAAEMLQAVLKRLADVRVVIGAAAVADYAPRSPGKGKMKKSDAGLTLELMPTKDIMAEVGRRKEGRVLVGFAAETQNLVENAKAKLHAKNLDLIVANDVSKPGIGFGADFNEVTIVDKSGGVEQLPRLPKIQIAHQILDSVKKALAQ